MKIKFPNNFIFLFLVFCQFFGTSLLSSPEIKETFLGENNYSKLNKNYLYNSQRDFYILGPGDEISISLTSDFKDIKVRVDGTGSINIPFLNLILFDKNYEQEIIDYFIRKYREFHNFKNFTYIFFTIFFSPRSPHTYSLTDLSY